MEISSVLEHEYLTLKTMSGLKGLHAGQSVTTFGTSNLPPQSLEGGEATGAKVDIGDWKDCGSMEVFSEFFPEVVWNIIQMLSILSNSSIKIR